jgi:acetoin utilization deacetylase AcuC-like enzyme
LVPGSGDDSYTSAITEAAALVTEKGCETLVVSLGVDAGADDPESPLNVSTRGFADAGAVLVGLGLPTVLVQEGGYHLPALERDLMAILTQFSSRR